MKAVDVLHAIGQADAALSSAGLQPFNIFRHELREARAAVAALIQAADAVQEADADQTLTDGDMESLRLALARVQGGQS